MTARDQYIAGLRALADLLERDETMPLPYDGTLMPVSIFYQRGENSRYRLANFAQMFPGKLAKVYNDDSDAFGFELHGTLGGASGLRIKAIGSRAAVCQRVVTGTRTEIVTEEITQVVGKRSVPVEVEIVEWVCDEPLLSQQVAS